MSSRFTRGASNLDGIIALAFIIFIFLISHGGKGGSNSFFSTSPSTGLRTSGTTISSGSSSSSSSSSGGTTSGPTIQSVSYPYISIDSGNASSEIQSYNEYVVVSNWNGTPTDITGWTLRNGKDKRNYTVGNQLQRFSADIAQIPRGAPLLLPSGNSPLQDIVLKNGERAIITTGSVTVHTPYAVTSFKENSCTGYLERLDDYNFQPPLQTSCPDPDNEPGIDKLDRQCRSFVESLWSCDTPKFQPKDREGNNCSTCVNGVILSSSCAAYVKEHFSYQGCVAYHAGDPNFSSATTWRVFLGRSWEMWGDNYETIELFDKNGNLAAFTNYR